VSSVPLLEALPAAGRDHAIATANQVAAASTRWLADHFVPTGCAPAELAGGCSPTPQTGSGCAPAELAGGCSPTPQTGSGCAPAELATHSLASTLACPNLSVAELTTLTCLRVWAAALAEQSDDPELCTDGLVALRRRLSRKPLFGTFGKQWQASMVAAVRAAATERSWRTRAAASGGLPRWDDYLANGATLLALRPYLLAACILTGGPGDWPEVIRLDPMVAAATRCLRVAGDLNRHATAPRDCALTLAVLAQRSLMSDGLGARAAFEQGRARLRTKCAVDLTFLRAQAEVAPPVRATLARALYTYTTVVCQCYGLVDDQVAAARRTPVLV
jgi:hypothetical protein